MMMLGIDEICILADKHHFILIVKDPLTQKRHLKAIKKVPYRHEIYDSIPKNNSSHVFDRRGLARSNQLGVDPKDHSAEDYLKDACRSIEQECKIGGYTKIILVALPEVIFMLKKVMSKNMKNKITKEIHKDYSKTSLYELEEILFQMYTG